MKTTEQEVPTDNTANALRETLFSTTMLGDDGPVNVVDVINSLANAAHKVAESIATGAAGPYHTGDGGQIGCVVEGMIATHLSMRDIASGLDKVAGSLDGVAEAISDGLTLLADAIRDHKQ